MNYKEDETREQRMSAVNMWINKLSTEGKVGDMDPQLLRSVLEDMGVKKEISEQGKAYLGNYRNYYKWPGLCEVWGREDMVSFRKWAKKEFVPAYENKIGKELPTLWDPKTQTYDTNKHSGMMQFLGELTAFAEGQLPLSEYRRLTEDRFQKGQKFENADPNKPYKPSKHAAFPPEFPVAAWEKIKSLKQAN